MGEAIYLELRNKPSAVFEDAFFLFIHPVLSAEWIDWLVPSFLEGSKHGFCPWSRSF